MIVSPSNIINGLMNIVELNRVNIDRVFNHYKTGDRLHVFKGMRKSLPLSAFPSLELEPSSGSQEWLTTSVKVGEYTIQFTLTVTCDNDEFGAEYICEATRAIVQVFTIPENLCWEIPNEKFGIEDDTRLYIQFGSIGGITYNSTKDGTIRIAQWDWTGKVYEPYLFSAPVGPKTMDTKIDELPGQ